MTQQSMKPQAFKRSAKDVVPEANIYTAATAAKTSTFKAVDKLSSKIGEQMNFQKSDDFWKDLSSNFSSVASGLTQYVSSTGEGFSFDTARMKSEIGAQFGNYSFMNELTDGQLDALGGYMDGGSLQVMYDTYGELSDLKSSDGMNASGILSAAQSFLGGAGNIALINNSAIFGLASTILDFVESTGMIGLFDDILRLIEDERTLNALLEERAIGAASSSDIKLCQHYVDSMGYSRAHAIRTDIIPMIVSAYKLDSADSRPFASRADDIVRLLNSIDHNWNTRGGRWYTQYFHMMSLDCVKVFSMLPDTRMSGLAIVCQEITGEMDAVALCSSILGVPLSE